MIHLANRLSTWYEDLEEYEGNLEEMATATLDQVERHWTNSEECPESNIQHGRRFKTKCNMSTNGLGFYQMQKRQLHSTPYYSIVHRYKSDSLYIYCKK